jgi:hypothetical protein
MLKERFFWESYGKYSLAVVAGLGLASVALGVPPEVSIRFGAGAVLSFPAAYAIAASRKPDRPDEGVASGPA